MFFDVDIWQVLKVCDVDILGSKISFDVVMGRRLSQVDPYNHYITPAIVPYSSVSYWPVNKQVTPNLVLKYNIDIWGLKKSKNL